MNLGAARTEFQARGFDYLSSTRCNAYLNRSLAALSGEADWPWLESTATGAAPLTISDLRAVLSVVDSTTSTELQPVDRRYIIAMLDVDPTTTGSPAYWYRSSLTAVSVYPANTTDTLSVQYVAFEAELSSDSDSPVLPSRHHNVWVDRAVYEAYVDSDNMDSAAALKQKIDGEVFEMKRQYMAPNHDRAFVVQSRRWHEGF